jgi:hypothetical protein
MDAAKRGLALPLRRQTPWRAGSGTSPLLLEQLVIGSDPELGRGREEAIALGSNPVNLCTGSRRGSAARDGLRQGPASVEPPLGADTRAGARKATTRSHGGSAGSSPVGPAGGRRKRGRPTLIRRRGSARAYLILVSLNGTCLRTTGSYFRNSSLPVAVRGFFLAT